MIKYKKLFTIFSLIGLFSSNVLAANEREFICANETVKININKSQINAKTACTMSQLTQGLMYVKEMSENVGMIFVFNNESKIGFWGKNTYIPLDLLFINNKFEVVDINLIKPLDQSIVKSKFPASYVIEVNNGWVKKNKIQIGDKIEVIK